MSDKQDKRTQSELDSLVVNIELTLISIIQGVALYFLIENSKSIILQKQWQYFPYVFTSLVIILTFWSRSIIHTLTVIRWPLKFWHNFLYITSTWVEAMSFNQLSNPVHWFALQTVFALMLWFLFMSDLEIIRQRMKDSQGFAGNSLYRMVQKDQFTNIRYLFPVNILFNVLCYLLIKKYPDYYLASQKHCWPASFQMIVAFVYLFYGTYFYQKLIPGIAHTRREWLEDTLIED